eukprot:scaffold1419_cov90-Cylindrotheca_fusiformis.AAC.2
MAEEAAAAEEASTTDGTTEVVEAETTKEFHHPTNVEYQMELPPPLSKESEEKVNDLFQQILYLDMIEVHLLTQVVNEQLGISWNETTTTELGFSSNNNVANGTAGSEQDEVVTTKVLKDLKLIGFDAKSKIKVIKEVRAIIAGLGLKEAKELVESAPKIIQKDLKPDKAQELKEQLEQVGAQIEIA